MCMRIAETNGERYGITMKFSEKIYNLRSENHLSQEEFAQILNVSRQTVSKYENGSTYPEIDKLIFISERFQVSIDYLLKDSEEISASREALDRLTLAFLGCAQDMDNVSKELIDIMRDGIIDEDEKVRLHKILDTLDSIEKVIASIRENITA